MVFPWIRCKPSYLRDRVSLSGLLAEAKNNERIWGPLVVQVAFCARHVGVLYRRMII